MIMENKEIVKMFSILSACTQEFRQVGNFYDKKLNLKITFLYKQVINIYCEG